MTRLLSFILCLWPVLAAAAPARDATGIEAYAHRLSHLERALKRTHPGARQLKAWSLEVTDGRAQALACVTAQTAAREKLIQDLAVLGKPTAGDPAEVVRKRRELRRRLKREDAAIARCRLLQLRSEELLQQLKARYNALVAERLLARGPDILSLLVHNWKQPAQWWTAASGFLRRHSGAERFGMADWGLLLLAALLGGGGGWFLRRRMQPHLVALEPGPGIASRFGCSVAAVTRHFAVPFLLSLALLLAMGYLTAGARPLPFVTVAALGLPAYVLALALIRIVLAPPPPGQPLLVLPDRLGPRLARRLKVLVLLSYLGYLLFYTLLSRALPQPVFLLARGLFGAFLVLNLAWALWLVARIPRLRTLRWLNGLMFLVLVAALAMEWLGYRNLAATVLRILLGTLFLLGLFGFFDRLLQEWYDDLADGRQPWSQRVRAFIGVQDGAPFPGLLWIRLLTVVSLWGTALLLVLRVWGASEATFKRIDEILVGGIDIGSLHLVPLRVLLAILVVFVLIAVSRWLQTRLEAQWLRHVRMERGARDALVTITGYLLVAAAVLVGLGIAGFDFGNLAIIAGALSVGVGFGLQNIVNNFVSGLILLFERPIRTGDWIVVGSTEGYVRRIRIRSTVIQTFDRADVIVPNSELISSQVTNWMLHNPRGRVRIPVGVAYGSDTARVREILEEVARAHPRVVKDGSSPQPKVLFRGFGDSALDFELRCFVYNIDERMQVTSDINFAIDAAFREAGIEIPFPQRDLHLRELPEGWRPGQRRRPRRAARGGGSVAKAEAPVSAPPRRRRDGAPPGEGGDDGGEGDD